MAQSDTRQARGRAFRGSHTRDLEDSGMRTGREEILSEVQKCGERGDCLCSGELSLGGGLLHAEVTPNSGLSFPPLSRKLLPGGASVKVSSRCLF